MSKDFTSLLFNGQHSNALMVHAHTVLSISLPILKIEQEQM